jgi:HK97 family phage major capsid protein
MAIDISRLTSGAADLLPPEVSTEIWESTIEQSAVMRLARQITMPGTGVTIPVITGDAAADWVSETDEKPVSRAALDSKLVTPYKLAVIEPFSNEFKRDLPGLYGELVRRLPSAIGRKFDATVFSSAAPGSNFATLGAAAAVALTPKASDVKQGTYAGLVQAYQAVATADGSLTGWALSSQAKGLLLNQVDTTGRPLLADSIAQGSSVPTLLGESVFYTKGVYSPGTPNVIGFAGDWSSAVWGTVSGIRVSVSEEASITDGVITLTTSGDDTVDIPKVINLFQRNMFAVLVEVEIGFQIRDLARFVKLTDATRS